MIGQGDWTFGAQSRASPRRGNLQVTILPKQSDIDLLAMLINIRDSADLAGHTDDLFRLIDVNGPDAIVHGPGWKSLVISKIKMRRLRDLGLFYDLDPGSKAFRFDLADDVRDRLEQMRVAVGRLSEPQRPDAGMGSGGQHKTQPQPRRPGRPKGTRSVTRDEILEKFRSLRANYGRNPTQRELADNLNPRIEPRTLQQHLTDYGLPWPIE